MKPTLCIWITLLSLLISGCSHIHYHSFPSTPANAITEKLSLDDFFSANRFEVVDIPNSKYAEMQSEFIERENITKIWEKWYKGVIFPASGGIRAVQKITNEKMMIVIDSWGREMEATEAAQNLTKWIENEYPDVKVEYRKKAYIDFR